MRPYLTEVQYFSCSPFIGTIYYSGSALESWN